MRTIFQDWRDEQSQQTYPFHDHVSPERFDGEPVPFGLVVDAMIHPPNAVGGYRLASIEITSPDITFRIADVFGEIVASGTYRSGSREPSSIALFSVETAETPAGLPAGVLVIRADVAEFLKHRWGDGSYELQQQTAAFVPATWEYTYFEASNTSDAIASIEGTEIQSTGDIYLVAENGVRMECAEDNTIRVHVIGDPLAKRARCETTVTVPRYVEQLIFQHNDETIVCSPGEHGEAWVLVVGDQGQESALRLYNQPHTLTFGFAAKPSSSNATK